MATQPVENAVAVIPNGDTERFNLMQREAKIFAYSPLIPEHLRKGGETTAIANCYIALKLAKTMGEDPLVVLQNIHIVSGKAGFSAQYMIARANSSGVFKGRIDWRIDRSNSANLSVTAFAVLKDTGQEVSVTCDMAMAQAEQWTKNPKYKSMPEVMLRYRSATFLVRFYAPDVMLGYQTAEEVTDISYASGPDLTASPLTGAMLIEQSQVGDVIDADTGEIVDDEEVDATAAEGRTDGQHGDQHDGAGPLDTVRDLIDRIDAAKTKADLKAIDEEFQRIGGGLPDADFDLIETRLAAAAKALNKKEG